MVDHLLCQNIESVTSRFEQSKGSKTWSACWGWCSSFSCSMWIKMTQISSANLCFRTTSFAHLHECKPSVCSNHTSCHQILIHPCKEICWLPNMGFWIVGSRTAKIHPMSKAQIPETIQTYFPKRAWVHPDCRPSFSAAIAAHRSQLLRAPRVIFAKHSKHHKRGWNENFKNPQSNWQLPKIATIL